MKKNRTYGLVDTIGLLKMLKMMRFTLYFLLLTLSQAFAVSTYSQQTKLSLDMKNARVEDVIDQIEKSSEFFFMYNKGMVNVDRKVDIVVEGQLVNQILDKLFENTDVTYSIKDRQIMLINSHLQGESVEATSQQQKKTISGKVTDSSGATLPGVSVVVKGTTYGVITDINGSYSLTNVPENANLQFSFVGMKGQEIAVSGKTTFNVIMIEDAIGIEEVVAIGYGTQKKVNLTGSVANVDFASLSNRPASNSVNALVGAIPGMTIVQGGGQPGNDVAAVSIRGMGSINANSDPLVIIDGVTANLSYFSALSPNEIESVSVLKDAASASIYGSRAANGVILVTTKAGLTNETKVSFNSYFGLQQATVKPEMLDAWDNALLENEARKNAGQPIFFSDKQIELMKNNDPSDGFDNVNWVEETYRTTPVQNYNLSINTGTGKLKVYSDFNYYKQEGIVRNTNSDRYNLRNKFDLEINKHIKLGMNISAIKKNTHTPYSNDWETLLIGRTHYAAPKYYNNGNYYKQFTDVPAYQILFPPHYATDYGYRNGINKKFISAFTAEIKWKGFKFNSLVSYNYEENIEKRWQPWWQIVDDTGKVVYNTDFAKLNQDFNNTEMIQVENYLNYNHKIGNNHSLSLLAGHTYFNSKYSYLGAYGDHFASNSTQVLRASSTDTQLAFGNDQEYSLQSLFGRVNYDYKGKYLLEANVRYDGSSRFAEGNRYGLFPSFSAGWRISKENFFQDLESVNNLKLRASWGILGNQDIGSNYAYASVYSTSASYLINGKLVNGAAITTLANDEINWESTNTSNLGIDVSFFNRLDLTFDYFIRNTQNMLIILPIPSTLGNVNPPYQNIGKVQNKGWELSGTYRGKINKLNYSLNFNVSDVKNKAVDLNDQKWYLNGSKQIIEEGESLNSWFGYIFDGIYQSQEEINAGPKRSEPVAPGDMIYRDISGINGVPDGKIDSYDRTVIGKSFPELTYGFGAGLSYANFDLNLFFQGVGNVDIDEKSNINHAGKGVNPMNWTVDWLNRWTPENPTQEYPRVHYVNRHNDRTHPSSYWIKDASYLRFKNLELGYSFKQDLLRNIGIDKLRLYVGGQNLLTFTKLKYFDPERARNSEGAFNNYPQLRTYQAGINLTF